MSGVFNKRPHLNQYSGEEQRVASDVIAAPACTHMRSHYMQVYTKTKQTKITNNNKEGPDGRERLRLGLVTFQLFWRLKQNDLKLNLRPVWVTWDGNASKMLL